MIIKMIEGATRVLGKSQGYLGLPLRDQSAETGGNVLDLKYDCRVNGPDTPEMVTAWEPTPDEVERLSRGAPLYLHVVGTGHPPVKLVVGEAPPPPPRSHRLDEALAIYFALASVVASAGGEVRVALDEDFERRQVRVSIEGDEVVVRSEPRA
jgi:hypothetical protein